MSKQTETLKLALEALELVTWTNNPPVNKAITAIREALAEQPAQQEPVAYWHKEFLKHNTTSDQPEQEPVFWYKPYPNGMYNGPIHNAQIGDVLRGAEEWLPLYTTPPQRKPLTDEEIERIYDRYGGNMMNCARAIERAHGIKGDT